MDGSGGGGGPSSLFSRKRTYTAMADSHRDTHDPTASTSNAAVDRAERAGSRNGLFVPHDDHYDNEHAARRLRLTLPPLQRFEGDGLDFRRPTFIQSVRSPVVDLTEDDSFEEEDNTVTTARERNAAEGPSAAQRPPRYGVEIVSLDDSDDEHFGPPPAHQRHPNDPLPRARPHLSILSRPNQHGQARLEDEAGPANRPSRTASNHRQRPRSATPYPVEDNANFIDLTEDDDVIITETRSRRGGINGEPPTATAGVGTHSEEGYANYGPFARIAGLIGGPNAGRIRARMPGGAFAEIQAHNRHGRQEQQQQQHRRHRLLGRPTLPPLDAGLLPQRPENQGYGNLGHVAAQVRQAQAQVHQAQAQVRQAHLQFHLQMHGMPNFMNYDQTGFNYAHPAEPGPAAAKYSPPPEAAPGFTRNPTEDEIVVCPNCGDELAVGGDDGKQTMWIIKTCGHAYCGDCTEQRKRNMKSKGKDRATEHYLTLPPPFTKCVVEGCGKPAGKSSMIRVYSG